MILVYDVTSKSTYENLNNWVVDLKDKAKKDLVVMLVGNKDDLINQKEVSTEDGKRFAEVYSYFFLETSAKENTNVDKAFKLLIEKASENLLKQFELEEYKDYSNARNSIQQIDTTGLIK